MHILAFALLLFVGVVSGAAVPKGLVPSLGGRIYGGQEAVLGQFPYAASFRFYGFHRCGAVLIHHNALITAAQCVHELPVYLMEVAIGLVVVNWGGVERWVRDYVMHPEFELTTFANDVAVMYTYKSVDFSPSIHPIAMASVGEDLRPGTLATVLGWGSFNDEGHYPSRLHYVKIRVVDRASCRNAYNGLNEVSDEMLCAGEPEGGKDACVGDGGGPLVSGNKVYALVSWGDDCGSKTYPRVYVRVGAYRAWIDQQLDKD